MEQSERGGLSQEAGFQACPITRLQRFRRRPRCQGHVAEANAGSLHCAGIPPLQAMAKPSSLLGCGLCWKPGALWKAVDLPSSLAGRLMKRDLVMLDQEEAATAARGAVHAPAAPRFAMVARGRQGGSTGARCPMGRQP
ncbi:MAG: hypothetical protein DI604_27590 [Delftia acidovorans]|nr:MAG: hypothetical protein DI604_27590 [Delftia acidovorans]